MKHTNNVLSFDAETNGLYGKAWALAAIVYDANGKLLSTFLARCPIDGETDGWVKENVLPHLEELKETHGDYTAMLKDFAEFYMQWKSGADVVFHMGIPVESKVLRDMVEQGHIGMRDGPYPPKDLVGYLDMAGEDPTSVDSYAKKHDLEVTDYGTTHHPLYDAEVTAKVYLDLMKKREQTLSSDK